MEQCSCCMSHVLLPLEQKTAMQIILYLLDEEDPSNLVSVLNAVKGGHIATYNALDKLRISDLINDQQEHEYGPRILSLKEKGKLLAYKIIEIEPFLSKQEFQPLEQKTSLQVLYHLVNHGGTLRYRALARSVYGGASALNTAIKKLCNVGLIDEFIEVKKQKRVFNLTDEGLSIAKRIVDIELILSSKSK